MICPDGSNRENLETLAGSLSLSGKIHFQGKCLNLALCFRYAAALCSTSHYKGWGNVIKRTMPQGLSVIAFGCRYAPSGMSISPRNGILIPQANELCNIRESAAYLDRLPESRARYPVEAIHAEYFYSGKNLSLLRSNCQKKVDQSASVNSAGVSRQGKFSALLRCGFCCVPLQFPETLEFPARILLRDFPEEKNLQECYCKLLDQYLQNIK